ncbi:hypothetical protein SAY87_012933 [Trapa incisa]|uniref:Transcription factor CBF/NF-Y/archaeal histone domain-containing protein n=1 Tax=Trapa incisa TaxID=236973 RepID=A0AAN7KIN3_9MYRT|nr:hypothetical protein SAY87_012933 [Trapa incisa]
MGGPEVLLSPKPRKCDLKAHFLFSFFLDRKSISKTVKNLFFFRLVRRGGNEPKDKSNDSMGTPKKRNNNRCREAQDQKEEEKKKKKGNESGKSIKINGDSVKRGRLIGPSPSSRHRGGEEKLKKNGSSKLIDVGNGDHSSCRKKQKREKEEEDDGEEASKLNVIPMSRVQRIVKSEGPDLRINQEAYFLINKATVFPSPNRSFLLFPTFGYAGLPVNESLSSRSIITSGEISLKLGTLATRRPLPTLENFIEQFCEDAFTSAAVHDPKRLLKYSHLSSVVNKERRYDFLSDFVPEKIKAEDALKEIKSEET